MTGRISIWCAVTVDGPAGVKSGDVMDNYGQLCCSWEADLNIQPSRNTDRTSVDITESFQALEP